MQPDDSHHRTQPDPPWLDGVFQADRDQELLEELDGWIRHKLRCILWRQWKRPHTRAKNLMKAGLTEDRAFARPSINVGRGGIVARAT